MDEKTIIERLQTLITKAAECDKSEDALRFSQAACNVANTLGAYNAAMHTAASTKKL